MKKLTMTLAAVGLAATALTGCERRTQTEPAERSVAMEQTTTTTTPETGAVGQQNDVNLNQDMSDTTDTTAFGGSGRTSGTPSEGFGETQGTAPDLRNEAGSTATGDLETSAPTMDEGFGGSGKAKKDAGMMMDAGTMTMDAGMTAAMDAGTMMMDAGSKTGAMKTTRDAGMK